MRILNLGSLNVDFVYRVDSFLAPGETKAALSREVHPGGKGLNQSLALAKAGARVWHAGKLGSGGELLERTLAEGGVDLSLLRPSALPAGHAIIQVEASGQNCILLFGGSNRDLGPEDLEAAFAPFGKGDLVLFQNEVNDVPAAMRLAAAHGLAIAFNPSPMEDAVRSYPLELVDYFILNEVEATALAGRGYAPGAAEALAGRGYAPGAATAHGAAPSDPEAAIGALLERAPSAAVVLTLGSEGSLYAKGAAPDGLRIRQRAYRVEAVDTTAAGDTFTGFFLAALAEGMSPAEALDLAAKAAAICVTRRGAASSIPSRAEVAAARLEPR